MTPQVHSPQLMIGNSPAIRGLIAEAEMAGRTDVSVLITGESGVGKELLARLVHGVSVRRLTPMVTINCGGIPDPLLGPELFGHVRESSPDGRTVRRGLLDAAHGGTILLDEIGEMSIRMQTRLLRFLESGETQRIGGAPGIVDVRVISATSRDLYEQTQEGAFRDDLFYRLNVVHLVIPPLRKRREDIGQLLHYCLEEVSQRYQRPACELSPEALAYLMAYPWPGNVSEMKRMAARLSVRRAGRTVSPSDLPSEVLRPGVEGPTVARAGC